VTLGGMSGIAGTSGASGGTTAGGAAGSASESGGAGGTGGGAGNGGAPAGGAGGQSSYSPCPAPGTPCKIMPLGDSITQGYRSSDLGGYRVELFQAALNGNKNITFVGSQSQGPNTVGGKPFPKSHEGHGGYTIDGGLGIQPSVVDWMKAAKPDIVTLMIGTNDVNNYYAWQTESATDLANAPTRLGKLMDTILAEDAHVFLFVAQITPTTIDAENTFVTSYNDAIPALVKARADAGKHIALVDMYTPFVGTASYKTVLLRGTSDSLHPANKGYTLMGDIWYASVKAVLP
jgi:lysophospholipase L1-like esterase